MLKIKTRLLEAATLPVVMVISVLILLVVLFVYSLWDMNFLYYASYHYKKQQQENLNSAIVLYSNDSTFLRDYNEEKVFRLYETDSASTVRFFTQQWGFYESVNVSSHNGNFSWTRKVHCLLKKNYPTGLPLWKWKSFHPAVIFSISF